MPYFSLLLYIGIFFIAVSFFCGWIRRKEFDKAMQIILILTGINLLEECVAYYCAVHFHQNHPVLRIYSLVEIVFVSLYFNYSVAWFKLRNTGYYIAAAGFMIGLADMLFRGTIYKLSDEFMFVESVTILSMALFALFQLVQSRNYVVITSIAHFWIAVLFVVYWSFSVFSLTFYDFLGKAAPVWTAYLFLAINYFYSLGIALIFYFYPKMKSYV